MNMNDPKYHLEKYVLPMFHLPPRPIFAWHGDSDIDADSITYYLTISNIDHILIFEDAPTHSTQWLEENLIRTGEKLEQITTINPDEAGYAQHNLSSEPSRYIHGITGTFRLYRVTK